MYTKLVGANDPYFSYRIVKNPNNIFERNINSKRKIVGKFTHSDDEYTASLFNDTDLFLETYREQNMQFYNTALLRCVSPFNLVLFVETYRSILLGKNGSKLDENVFNETHDYFMQIGPFATINEKDLAELCEAAGISFVKESLYVEQCSEIIFSTREPLTLTQFLQRVYCICYIITMNLDFLQNMRLNEKQEQMKKFMEDWMENLPNKLSFMRKLAGYNTKAINQIAEKMGEEVPERKKNLHTLRHEAIAAFAKRIERDNLPLKVLELGCGSGQLYPHLEKACENLVYFGIDSDSYKIERAKTKYGRGKFKLSNILFPDILESDLQPDLLILTEVIEHLDKENRAKLIRLILNFYQPKYIVITTPNVDYNVIYNLQEGELRHKDHKIEFNLDGLIEEIVAPLSDKYSATYVHMNEDSDVKKQPSFIVQFEYIGEENPVVNKKILAKLRELHSGMYLPISNFEISAIDMNSGFCYPGSETAFYLGPTISPAEYTDSFPDYLEHPQSVFDYYANKGVEYVDVEHKYMGSRGYIYANRIKNEIKITSRSGFTFFDNDKKYLVDGKELSKAEIEEIIFNEIFQNTQENIFILDCEILPWVLKAEKLIIKEFVIPAEAEYLFQKFHNTLNSTVLDMLQTVENFTKNSPLEIRVFDILAHGNNERDIELFYTASRDTRYELMDEMFSEGNQIVKPVYHYTICLESERECNQAIKAWEYYCKNGGEGFVIKAEHMYLPNGFLLQPAVKVRGKQYLQMIYGIYYLEQLDRLKRRNIKRKRQQAIIEYELSCNIIKTLFNNPEQHMRYIAAFYASSESAHKIIDATL